MKVFADFQVLVGYFKITNQTLHTLEKPRHFKTAIATELEVVSIIRKHIWNYHFKFYILSFVHIVTKILSSKLLAYKGSGGITRQKFPLESFDKQKHKK